MVKPGPDDSEFVSLSDDYIRQLQPDGHRYDITLAPDFVISVLPNGIKTWAFIYDFQGRNRRRTLGVYPDMSLAEAKAAMQKSRQAIRRMDEPTEPPQELGSGPAVLGGGAYVPIQAAPKPKWFLRTLLVAMLLIAIGAGGFFLFQKNSSKQPEPGAGFSLDQARPSATAPPQPRTPAPTKPGRLPFDIVPEKPAKKPQEADPPPAAPENSADPPTASTGGTAATARATPLPATTNMQAAGNSTAQLAQSRELIENNGKITPASARATPVVQEGPANTAPQAKPSSTADRSGAAAALSGAAPPSALPEGVTAYGGSVARSVLTSRVQKLEPTDVIGPEISHRNSGFTRVFYFTELREFSDGKVLHRWEHNGEVIEEVLLKVQKSWRWRTYSNKDITPGLTGRWRVSTIDASGKVLDTEEFTYGLE